MSELRQDPTTKDWVIIATERGRRPDDFAQTHTGHVGREHLPARSRTCPFCPGNEAETPPTILQYPHQPNGKSGSGNWQVRVTANKFAALVPEGSTHRTLEHGMFRRMDGVGHHEVVIETPLHNRPLALMNDSEVRLVLQAYRDRYQALRQDPRVKLIIIFENHGPTAGTSLEHPHSQIVATPIAPGHVRRRLEVAQRHYDDTGQCLYQEVVETERKAGDRVVDETEHFVVFHPFASRSPFETWIAPKRPCGSFVQVTEQELGGLAPILRHTMLQLHTGLNDPDYNLILSTVPVEDEEKPYYMWHMQIFPRLTTVAGFELGSGIYINTALPEQTADFIRHLSVG